MSFPTYEQEVERKAIDTLYSLEARRERGEISMREAAIAAGAIWDCFCGLVSTDTSELAAAMFNRMDN